MQYSEQQLPDGQRELDTQTSGYSLCSTACQTTDRLQSRGKGSLAGTVAIQKKRKQTKELKNESLKEETSTKEPTG
jgi:hypothetical protein